MTDWIPEIDTTASPLFKELVRVLGADVSSGRLAAGDRLPTHRVLAARLGVARGTVARAYAEAERVGLIQSEVGRGSFVRGEQSTSRPLAAFSRWDPSLIDLSVNLPLYEGDPDLSRALRCLSKNSDLQELLQYQPQTGMAPHRASGCKWLQRCGVSAIADDVILCAGAQHAMMVVCSAISSPDDVIVTDCLTYPGIKAVAQSLHLELRGVAMDREGLLPGEFNAACRKGRVRALYCNPTIQNPTSAIMSAQRRAEVLEIAAEHDVLIVEDDIHRLHATDPPPTLKNLLPDRVFSIHSLSKTMAGGLRVAYLAPPSDFLEAAAHQVLATNWMVSPVTSALASLWIEDGTVDRVVERKNREAAERQEIVQEVLGRYSLRTQPSSLVAWLDLPPDQPCAEFAMEARRRGVAVTPANVFYVGPGPMPNGVRICLGPARSREHLRAGLRILSKILSSGPGASMAIV